MLCNYVETEYLKVTHLWYKTRAGRVRIYPFRQHYRRFDENYLVRVFSETQPIPESHQLATVLATVGDFGGDTIMR